MSRLAVGLAVALPVRYRIYFGERLDFEGYPDETDDEIRSKVDTVRDALAALLEHPAKDVVIKNL